MLRLLYSRPDPSKSSGSKPLATYRRRSRFAAFWFFCLIVSVIALSFCLGLMLGWSGAERTMVQSRRPLMPSQTLAAMPRNAPDTISNNFVPGIAEIAETLSHSTRCNVSWRLGRIPERKRNL